MSLLMDALEKVEREKSNRVTPAGPVDMPLEFHPEFEQSASPQQGPLSSLFGKASEAVPTKAANDVFVTKFPESKFPQHIKYIIAATLCVFILLLVTGYAYYKSVLVSIQGDINAFSSPVMQQPQLAQKDRVKPRVETERQDQVVSPEKKQVVAVEKKISTTKAETRTKTVARARSAQKPPVVSDLHSTSIKIERQLVLDSIYQLLSQAYAAYQLGRDDEAISVYSKVLQQEKNNRDAMLGLAAISIRNAQYEKARDTYLALLENNPKDSVAMSGLINIQSNVDPVRSETRVKLLLDHNSDSPYLLFTLGSLYASQQRWAEAQEVFFRAHSSDSQNADITYNLAVSLDQLEQRKVALKYYRIALDLVKKQVVTFKVNDVIQRISVLQEVSAG